MSSLPSLELHSMMNKIPFSLMCTNNLEHLANMLCTLEVFVEQFSNFITIWSKDEVFMIVVHDICGEFPCGVAYGWLL